MINEVIPTPTFSGKVKRLAKKFKTLFDSLDELENQLLTNPRIGTPYGKNIYKIRLADESKGKGKSGGFRVITYVIEERANGMDIYLVTIFDKSEEATIKKPDAIKLIKKCGLM